MADEFILETHGLTKEFAGFFAVRDVDLRVRRGSIHALIGPNGAGKTTCFNLLTKFLRPSAGQILYKFVFLDIAPVNVAAHSSNLQACGGCDVEYRQQLVADLIGCLC